MTIEERIAEAAIEIEHDCIHYVGSAYMETRELNRDECKEVLRTLVRDVLLQAQSDLLPTNTVREAIDAIDYLMPEVKP